ncbi:response regulator [Parasediminibacterium sp. JCM 36343]|uniref:response regulator n=1 Tax=Parasediminibacterium sp. JCM 36343 TaxID=3374279 RepID=UPI00397DBC78
MNWKILLADDDLEDRMIIKEALESFDAGNIILFAKNGADVLDILNKNYLLNKIPQLIVLDLNMPLLNGTQTLTLIMADERFKHIPVVIYSTSINPLEKEKCMQLGARYYITKPISYQESIQTARHFLELCE